MIGLWFSEYVCVCVCAYLSCFLYVRACVQVCSLTSPPRSPSILAQSKIKTSSWQRRLAMRAHLRNAPSMLYSTSKCGGPVGGIHFCHHLCWRGSANHTSSATISGLPVGIAVPQWAVSFVPHSLWKTPVSNQRVTIFKSGP